MWQRLARRKTRGPEALAIHSYLQPRRNQGVVSYYLLYCCLLYSQIIVISMPVANNRDICFLQRFEPANTEIPSLIPSPHHKCKELTGGTTTSRCPQAAQSTSSTSKVDLVKNGGLFNSLAPAGNGGDDEDPPKSKQVTGGHYIEEWDDAYFENLWACLEEDEEQEEPPKKKMRKAPDNEEEVIGEADDDDDFGLNEGGEEEEDEDEFEDEYDQKQWIQAQKGDELDEEELGEQNAYGVVDREDSVHIDIEDVREMRRRRRKKKDEEY